MIDLAPDRIATEAGARIAARGAGGGPRRAVVDSRQTQHGDLFFGLAGEHADGGRFAAEALEAGAWGVVVTPEYAAGLGAPGSWVLSADRPLVALQRLARGWRRELGVPVVAITGSTGKTSVKDICRAILPCRTHVSPENYNTEIGLPLAILEATRDAEVLVLEMAMRGIGQIAELCRIAEPDLAAITNVGPVHLELLGTLEAIAAAKAEILEGLGERGRAVLPEEAEALAPHLRDELVTVTFGPGGDVFALASSVEGQRMTATIGTAHGERPFRFPFSEAHNLTNALCAVAIGVALDFPVAEMAERAPRVVFSRLRGQRVELAGGVVLINDCYNANPISMRAALDHLRSLEPSGRRLAVLGGMAELGPDGPAYHREIGALVRELEIGPVLGVGELARDYAPDAWVPDPEAGATALLRLIEPGDAVLVKGSRALELERLTDEVVARHTEVAR